MTNRIAFILALSFSILFGVDTPKEIDSPSQIITEIQFDADAFQQNHLIKKGMSERDKKALARMGLSQMRKNNRAIFKKNLNELRAQAKVGNTTLIQDAMRNVKRDHQISTQRRSRSTGTEFEFGTIASLYEAFGYVLATSGDGCDGCPGNLDEMEDVASFPIFRQDSFEDWASDLGFTEYYFQFIDENETGEYDDGEIYAVSCEGSNISDYMTVAYNGSVYDLEFDDFWMQAYDFDWEVEEEDGNYSLSFDGEDDYVDIVDIPSNLNSFSYMGWYKKYEATGIGQPIINTPNGKVIFSASGELIYASAYQNRNGTAPAFELGTVEYGGTNNWNQFAFVVNGDNQLLYINGELVDSESEQYDFNDVYALSQIGSEGKSNANNDSYFNGLLDELSVWDIALTEGQIQAYTNSPLSGDEQGLVSYWNFNDGEGTTLTDLSGNDNHGTIYGATWSEDVPNDENDEFEFLGEFNGHEYYVSNFESTWSDAYNMVEDEEVHLVTISSQEENDFVLEHTGGDVWIGFTDQYEEGNWEWVTGEDVVYTNWFQEEPNNSNGEEHWAEMANDGSWNDLPEEIMRLFVVEVVEGQDFELTDFEITINGIDVTDIEAGESATVQINFDMNTGSEPYAGMMGIFYDANFNGDLNPEYDLNLFEEDGEGPAVLLVDNMEPDVNPEVGVMDIILNAEDGDEGLGFLTMFQNSSWHFTSYDPEYDEFGGSTATLNVTGFESGYSISGNTEPPTPNMMVYTMIGDNMEQFPHLTFTQDDGSYHVDVAQAGSYIVGMDDGLEIYENLFASPGMHFVDVLGHEINIDFNIVSYDVMVSGIVTNPEGEGIWDAEVNFSYHDEDENVHIESDAWTDEDGYYELLLLAGYEYEVKVLADGYDDWYGDIMVNGNMQHNVTLNPEDNNINPPHIEHADDVPNDQGRQMRLVWNPGNPGGMNYFEFFSIWREVDEGTMILWDFIEVVPWHGFEPYSAVVPTLGDSTDMGIYWSTFRVTGHTENPNEFYDSVPVSGYSIDNLHPGAPGGVQAFTGGEGILLTWDSSMDEDFGYHRIYRYDTDSGDPAIQFTTVDTFYVDDAAEGNYEYWITAVDLNGNESDPSIIVTVTLAIDNGLAVPMEFALQQNYPNPFNPSTQIQYALPTDANVTIAIYDLVGRQIRTLVNEQVTAGFHSTLWNATNDMGSPVSAGVYIYTITANDFRDVKKMILLK